MELTPVQQRMYEGAMKGFESLRAKYRAEGKHLDSPVFSPELPAKLKALVQTQGLPKEEQLQKITEITGRNEYARLSPEDVKAVLKSFKKMQEQGLCKSDRRTNRQVIRPH
jgi:hypothetical protein